MKGGLVEYLKMLALICHILKKNKSGQIPFYMDIHVIKSPAIIGLNCVFEFSLLYYPRN